MAGDGDQEDRTEAATAHHLAQAREAGDIPLSRDLASLAGLGAAALVLDMVVPSATHELARHLAAVVEHAGQWQGDGLVPGALGFLLPSMLMLVGPIALAVVVGGVGAVLLQSGFGMRSSALLPDLSRLDPRQGLKRVIGLDNLVEAGKSVLKIGLLSLIVYRSLADALPLLRKMMMWRTEAMLDQATRSILHLVMMLIAVQAVLAGLDYLWVRLRYSKRHRMSREDVKQERKEQDGDPHIKARLRQLRMMKSRKRMMAAVPKATVVVTNPTHYAIALAYDRNSSAAPKVVAKGVDEVAARIRELARASGVPLFPNPPLARALYAVPVDGEIPAEHFKAVAEIIAYVWRLGQRRAA